MSKFLSALAVASVLAGAGLSSSAVAGARGVAAGPAVTDARVQNAQVELRFGEPRYDRHYDDGGYRYGQRYYGGGDRYGYGYRHREPRRCVYRYRDNRWAHGYVPYC